MNRIQRLQTKLDNMTDQLQVLEMAEGYHYMLGSKLNNRWEALRDQYERIAGKPWKYRSN